MKKIYFYTLILCAIAMSSCKLQVVPQAMSSVDALRIKDLHLEQNDYQIIQQDTVNATIVYHQPGKHKHIIKELNGDFSAKYRRDKATKKYYLKKFVGVARFGYLNNELTDMKQFSEMSPAEVVRQLAIYKLIQDCQQAGGDSMIEPIINVDIQKVGTEIFFTANASAKFIKINTNQK